MDSPLPLLRPILIIEDDRQTLAIMARLVRARGFQVLTADSLSEARFRARTETLGFIISDLHLPDGDACEFMAGLHASAGLYGVAITGFGMEGDLTRTRAAGFLLHLTKPIQVSDLNRALVLATIELEKFTQGLEPTA